jgi:hypothetical protein
LSLCLVGFTVKVNGKTNKIKKPIKRRSEPKITADRNYKVEPILIEMQDSKPLFQAPAIDPKLFRD